MIAQDFSSHVIPLTY
uniref:Uncharacterized protein n=1 Tax=Anguilla anguilla TaxID=7936 RepID=A0A0E9S0Y8_ANGAN